MARLQVSLHAVARLFTGVKRHIARLPGSSHASRTGGLFTGLKQRRSLYIGVQSLSPPKHRRKESKRALREHRRTESKPTKT
jgi:hypothetical protein